MNSLVQVPAVIGGSIVLTSVAGRVTDLLLRRAGARHPETPLWNMLRRCRSAVRLLLFAAVLRAVYRQIAWEPLQEHEAAVGEVLTLVLIGAGAWCVVLVTSAVVESSYARYALGTR
ncbi:mechanosensitive ion channel family protein, partial [Streptomyces nojiriensis]